MEWKRDEEEEEGMYSGRKEGSKEGRKGSLFIS